MKHIEINVNFAREQVLNGTLDIQYIPTFDQSTDCSLTLSFTAYSRCCPTSTTFEGGRVPICLDTLVLPLTIC